MVMGSRKTAPALRARPSRSYVPLRRVRTKVSSPAPYPDSPAETFFTHKFKSVCIETGNSGNSIRVRCLPCCKPREKFVKFIDRIRKINYIIF